MRNFCGNCGARLPENARYCMSCGSPIPQHETCPTCGQLWPGKLEHSESAASDGQQEIALDVLSMPPAIAPGLYLRDGQHLYFDGANWCHVSLVGGIPIPDTSKQIDDLEIDLEVVQLLIADDRDETSHPRGPLPGPNYEPYRDCGNCGFALVEAEDGCGACGSRNTGPVFDPTLLT